jgi:hypothetical protein
MGAIALAEGALAERVFVATDELLSLPEMNVFGDPVVVTRGHALVLGPQLADAAAAGKRVTLVAHARDLSGLREVFAVGSGSCAVARSG